MTDTSSSSCKIVIKAANQKYEDFNVDAPELEWTIKQLKQHLSENYPSNPSAESIRLIYSGKLLHDHWTLKECLRQNLQSSHIIHIVHPASSGAAAGAKAGSPGPRSAGASADDTYSGLDDELTPGSSSNSDASSSSSDSSTPVQGNSEFVNNPLNTFNQLQNNLNNLIQQQQRRQQQQQAQQQYQQMSSKEQYNMIHANLLRYYEAMGVNVASNAWYSAYIQHLALYNYMYSNYLQSIGVVGAPNSATAPASASTSPTTTTQETQNDRAPAEENPAPAQQPAQPAAPAARPAAQLNQAAIGGAAQDMGDREDDWLGVLHNICSFLILFSIIYYYSSFERFVLIFSIVFILILYHNGWLTLQRRPAANANRRNAAPAAPNRPAGAQDPAQPDAPAGNNEQDPAAAAGADAPPPAPAPNPSTFRLVLTFVFTFFTSLVPERPQAAA